MAIKLLTTLKDLTLSGLEAPKSCHCLSRNLARVSIWGALGSGAIALASSVFSRSLVQEGSWKEFAPYVFKVSLASCGTFTLFAVFLCYRLWQISTAEDKKKAACTCKLNAQVISLEQGLVYASSIVGLVAVLVRDFLNPNQMTKSLAERSVQSLMGIALTNVAIIIFHDHHHRVFS
jgi:hypothetical protein